MKCKARISHGDIPTRCSRNAVINGQCMRHFQSTNTKLVDMTVEKKCRDCKVPIRATKQTLYCPGCKERRNSESRLRHQARRLRTHKDDNLEFVTSYPDTINNLTEDKRKELMRRK